MPVARRLQLSPLKIAMLMGIVILNGSDFRSILAKGMFPKQAVWDGIGVLRLNCAS